MSAKFKLQIIWLKLAVDSMSRNSTNRIAFRELLKLPWNSLERIVEIVYVHFSLLKKSKLNILDLIFILFLNCIYLIKKKLIIIITYVGIIYHYDRSIKYLQIFLKILSVGNIKDFFEFLKSCYDILLNYV